MSLVDGSYNSLLQGMSQQPDRSRLEGQCTLQQNLLSDPVDGLKRRPPLTKVANVSTYHTDNLIYQYDTGLEQYLVVFMNDLSVEVYDLLGVQKTVNNQATSYLSTTPKIDLRLVTIGDYTIIANATKVTALKSDVKEATSAALIYFKDGGEYGRKYTVTIDGTVEATYTTPGGSTPATEAAQTGTDYVTAQIFAGLSRTGYTFTRLENVIHVKRTSGTTPIDIQVSDDRGNLFAIIIQDEVTKIGNLPLYAIPGQVVTIVGEGTKDSDDVYMEATGSGTVLTEVVWRETVARDIPYLFDEDTMPHALIRLADGTFYCGPLDGGLYSNTTGTHTGTTSVTVMTDSTATFTVDALIGLTITNTTDGSSGVITNNTATTITVVALTGGTDNDWDTSDAYVVNGTTIETWRERAAGDEDSNPVKAFVGNTIEFLSSIQERLVMLSGEFNCMSATNSFFNFWNKTATTLLDSDPIELSNPATAATNLKTAVQFNKDLVVFSELAQFVVPGSSVLTPKNAVMVPASAFKSDTSVIPEAAGSNVFFAITYGSFSGIRELFIDTTAAAKLDSRKITEHVNKLIVGSITRMAVNTDLGLLVLTTADEPTILYVYKYLWGDDGITRLQSSWSYWTVSTEAIKHVFWKDSSIYFITKDDTEYSIGAVDTADLTPTAMPFNIYLDAQGTATPDANYQFTIVNNIPTEAELIVVQAADANYPGMRAQVASITAGGLVTLKEDVGGDVYYGKRYSSRYKPTMPLFKDQNGIAINTSTLIINSMLVSYEDTGHFNFLVTSDYVDTTTQEFQSRPVGDVSTIVGTQPIRSGVFLADVGSDRALAEVEISTDLYLPMTLTDLEWTGQFTKQGRRV